MSMEFLAIIVMVSSIFLYVRGHLHFAKLDYAAGIGAVFLALIAYGVVVYLVNFQITNRFYIAEVAYGVALLLSLTSGGWGHRTAARSKIKAKSDES